MRFHCDGTKPTDEASVFVFGSNLAGAHAGGAAKVAAHGFGAQQGVPIGITGSSYAIPTVDKVGHRLPLKIIKGHIETFLSYAREHPDVAFWLTRVGCGIAGYLDEDLAPLFKRAPANIDLPEPWRQFV